jgi:hypothetical protein
MEYNIEGVVGQIVECSSAKTVIGAPVKDEKEWQDWLQDFQLKSNSVWIVRNTLPSCSRATFSKDYVCQHLDFNKAVHSSKQSKNTACKAKLSVKIKPMTASTRAKDKYVQVGMIYTYFLWLGALNIGLTETVIARQQSFLIYYCIFTLNKSRCEAIPFYLVMFGPCVEFHQVHFLPLLKKGGESHLPFHP